MDNEVIVRATAAFARRAFFTGGRAVFLIIGPVLAASQAPPTGSLVPRNSENWMSEKARMNNPKEARRSANRGHEALRRFASCVVSRANSSRERRDLVAFLTTSPEDRSAEALAVKIAKNPNGSCFDTGGASSVALRFHAGLLRGAIYRQLYIDLGTRSSPVLSRDELADAWLIPMDGSYAANQRFGDCIVTADNAAADAFVRADVDSDRQNSSLNSLVGRMKSCLTEGATLQMSRVNLDALLSEVLYRKAADLRFAVKSMKE